MDEWKQVWDWARGVWGAATPIDLVQFAGYDDRPDFVAELSFNRFFPVWYEVYPALNHTRDHELYWRGRADIWGIDDDGVVEVGVNEDFRNRVAPIMLALGYELVSTSFMDLGDDDCPKPEVFTKWRKPGVVAALENADVDELLCSSLGG